MKLKLTLFLLSACLVFSACGGQSASFPDNSSVSSDWEGTPHSLESQTQPEMQMAMPAGSLPMIAGNNEGAYYIWANGQDPSGLTLYYDYASRQLIHLSNQVLPTNDEENPGWIADIFGGAAPIAVNGKFYVLKYGKAVNSARNGAECRKPQALDFAERHAFQELFGNCRRRNRSIPFTCIIRFIYTANYRGLIVPYRFRSGKNKHPV